jgi:hypothetical protein
VLVEGTCLWVGAHWKAARCSLIGMLHA